MTHQLFLNHFRLPKSLLNSSKNIYLDTASSTPVDLRVYQKMEPWQLEHFGNSSSFLHSMGEKSREGLEAARAQCAQIFGVQADEVIFTSSATESNNLLLRGLIENPLQKRHKIVLGATEHSSLATTAKILSQNLGKRLGFEFCTLPVDSNGQIILEEAKKIIDEKTLYVCVMDVNNETGIVQKTLPEIAQITHKVGAYLHVDAAQGFARNNSLALQVDFDSAVVSSSKIYGPKGAAAFIMKKRRPRIFLEPQITGGGQEFGIRASSVNVAAVIGFSHACLLQKEECDIRIKHYEHLEKLFVAEMKKNIDACFYGSESSKIGGIVSLTIPNVNAMKLLENTSEVCASVGSACKTLQATASHVLLNMGVELEQALSSFRVSFGLINTEEEVIYAAQALAQNAHKLRETHKWI